MRLLRINNPFPSRDRQGAVFSWSSESPNLIEPQNDDAAPPAMPKLASASEWLVLSKTVGVLHQ